MRVTSMLSNGYLQPSQLQPSQVAQNSRKEQDGAAASLAVQEAQILAQEQALKMQTGPGGQVSTTYRYSVGPDGRRYITGAEVKIEGDEQVVDRVGGGVKKLTGRQGTEAADEGKEQGSKSQPSESKASSESPNASELSDEAKQAVSELKQIEREVINHEAAHKAVGGRFAGAVSYTTTQGPDGKSYITGGEVPISVPASSDPEETARNAEQVRRAALAPANPSGQDLSVAAQAAATAAQARQEISAQVNGGGEPAAAGENPGEKDGRAGEAGALKSGASSVQAEVRFRQIWADRDEASAAEGKGKEDFSSLSLSVDPREAYALYASNQGLWTLERGFEQDPVKKEESLLNFAA